MRFVGFVELYLQLVLAARVWEALVTDFCEFSEEQSLDYMDKVQHRAMSRQSIGESH